MTDQAPVTAPFPSQQSDSLVSTFHITYALHALGLALGAFGASTVVGSFLFGWPSIIAVIINYVKRREARGTWLESHVELADHHLLVGARVDLRHRHPGLPAGDRAGGLRDLVRRVLRPGRLGHLPHRARLAGAEGAADDALAVRLQASRLQAPGPRPRAPAELRESADNGSGAAALRSPRPRVTARISREIQALSGLATRLLFAGPVAHPTPNAAANKIEIALGRTAAACVHPVAAWLTKRRSMRAMLVAGYFVIGFSAVLTAAPTGPYLVPPSARSTCPKGH